MNAKRRDRCITKYLCCGTESLQPRGWTALRNDEAMTGSDEELRSRINYTCNYLEKTVPVTSLCDPFKGLPPRDLEKK